MYAWEAPVKSLLQLEVSHVVCMEEQLLLQPLLLQLTVADLPSFLAPPTLRLLALESL
jgi:hypothetical protein